jgi:predicted Zn-dependent peptidase
MEHLDTATLEDFKDFHKILHPNNAVLVVAGDFETKQKNGSKNTLALSKKAVLKKQTFIEKPITQTIKTFTTLTYKYRWSLLPTEHRQ